MTQGSAIERVRAFRQWLSDSEAAAERLMPDLLARPASALRRELRRRPELHTPGMMNCLLDVARNARDRFPHWACALTATVVELAPFVAVPPGMPYAARTLQADASLEHARALHAAGALADAQRAVARARALFEHETAWYADLADVIEGRILHDLGLRDRGLAMVRRAAEALALSQVHKHYAEARLAEAAMLWRAGNRSGAMAIWPALAREAESRGDLPLAAEVERRMGTLLLREGSPELAAPLLASAIERFEAAHLGREALRARWHLAEARAAQGLLAEAIAELDRVRNGLLAARHTIEAALASADILELLLAAGRTRELASAAATFAAALRAALPGNALDAVESLRTAAAAGALTREAVAAVRRYLIDFRLQPHQPFQGWR